MWPSMECLYQVLITHRDRKGEDWKGEWNKLREFTGVYRNLTLFCVHCEGVEGKAGMAAIANTVGQFDQDTFLQAVKKALPSYAHPVFLRLMPHVDTTGETLTSTALTHRHPGKKSLEDLFLYFCPQVPLKFGRFGFRRKDTIHNIQANRFIF